MALKFIAHFAWISIALNPPEADTELWDEQEGFYYDVMRTSDVGRIPLRVRSLVGLLPMCAIDRVRGRESTRNPEIADARGSWTTSPRPPGPRACRASPEGHRLLRWSTSRRGCGGSWR